MFSGSARGEEVLAPTPIRPDALGGATAPPTPDFLVLQAVSQALMAWDPLEAGAQYLLSEMATALALSGAVLWRAHDEHLIPLASWMEDPADRLSFADALLGPDAHRWSQLAELARAQGGPILDVSARDDPEVAGQFPGLAYLRGVVAVPARAGTDTVGVVVGYGSDVCDFVAPSLETLGAVGQLLGDLLERWQFQEDHARLTRRELELLTLASRGLTTAKIAAQLSLSPWTVKTHFEHIRLKLEAPDRTAAVAHALRTGMIV